jgi:6-phosphogluconolactonase
MAPTNFTRRDFLKVGALGTLGLALPSLRRRITTADDLRLYVGTYTSGKSEGIYQLNMREISGELTRVGTARGVNPSFLTIDRAGTHLYAVNETPQFGGKPGGAVSSFGINPANGDLKFLNQQPTLGADPCHLVVDKTGKFLLVANYTGGSVATLPVRTDGSLGPPSDLAQHKGSSVNPKRQEGPHAHCVAFDRDGRFLLVADLGLDKIMLYRLEATSGKLIANDPPWIATKPGAGPRHIAFSPSGDFVYVINELDSTIVACAYDRTHGTPKPFQTVSTLPPGYAGANTCAEIEVSPSGKFLYGSNRGHNSVVGFAVDASNGSLKYVGHQSTRGRTPRSFAIEPAGDFLLVANQDTDNIVVLRLNPDDGQLSPTGRLIEVPNPVCLKFLV